MGIDATFGAAFAKAQFAAGTVLPTKGAAFLSVPADEADRVVPVARHLVAAGMRLLATKGTAAGLRKAGFEVEVINKVGEGSPHVVDKLRGGEVALVVNTPAGGASYRDSFPIRRTALECQVPYFTTYAAATAAAAGIELLGRTRFGVKPLQEFYEARGGGGARR
jgi:carbamoyl-phosphate synthase large subunit